MDKLENIYYDVADSGGYVGIRGLYRSAREKGIKVTLKNVKEFLQNQDTYTLHKNTRWRYKRNKTIVYGIDEQWQADLIDLQKLSKQNGGYRYILACIDIFSKHAFVEPVQNKKGDTIVNALKKILDGERRPKRIQSDHGNEFVCKAVQAELKFRGIEFFATNSEVKASVVERFIRSFKSRMYRYFTAKNTYTYVDILQELVSAYNNSYHRSIKCKPIEVTTENSKLIWKNLYGDIDFSPPVKYDFEIGDIVRISKNKGLFEKGYLPNFSEELFRVIKRIPRQPSVYKLEALDSEPILGVFYKEEVQKVGKDLKTCTFQIEKVLRKRRKSNNTVELLVRWKGYGPQFDSWVQEIDLV